MKKNIVVIGGGNGASITLQALKRLKDQCNIKAIISVADSGGSSGSLRQEFNIIPPGDILRAILALSPYNYETLRDIFYSRRFQGIQKEKEHNLGNLFLAFSGVYTKDFISGIRAFEHAVCSVGRVYPASLDPIHLCVRLSNGDIVRTEAAIDRPTYDRSLRIQRAWLEPKGILAKNARDALYEADMIILGPGSLYTSIIAPLLVSGMKDFFASNSKKVIYILSNSYERIGETGPTSASENIAELEQYLSCPLHAVLHLHHRLSNNERAQYHEKGWAYLEKDVDFFPDKRYIVRDAELHEGGIDQEKLAVVLREIIE